MKISDTLITSRSGERVKLFASLSDKKGRQKSGLFIAEGIKLTLEAAACRLPVCFVVVSEKIADALREKIISAFLDSAFDRTELITVSPGVFEKISTEKSPEGVLCVIKHLDFFHKMDIIYKEEFFLSHNIRTVSLYSVRDPQNLGAVIRSSVALGVEHIVLSPDCADLYNPKTLRAAMGSLFHIEVTRVLDFESFIRAAQASGRRVFSAELRDGAIPLGEARLCATDILVIGNEGHGIPSEISSLSDGSVYIPISDKTESLNASVAAALFMWEQSKL